MFDQFPPDKNFFQLNTLDKKTPFAIAVEYNHYSYLKAFLERPEVAVLADYGTLALVPAAIRTRNFEVLEKLIEMKAMYSDILQIACRQTNGHQLFKDLEAKNFLTIEIMSKAITEDGFTPLMTAVKYGQVECVRELLSDQFFHAEMFESTTTDFERTVLHICAEYHNDKITNLLVEKEKLIAADLARLDVMGNTPLHICVQKKNMHMFEQMFGTAEQSVNTSVVSTFGSPNQTISLGAMLTLFKMRNNNGLTAFDEAIKNGDNPMVELMIKLSSGDKTLLEDYDIKLRTSLHVAALKGKDRIRLLR